VSDQFEPKLSLVVATYNRSELLGLLLDDLDRQTLSPNAFEVIVVDDGSAIPAAGVIEGRSPAYELRLIAQANTGQAAARHRGICEARNEVIVIVDDDMRLPRDFLEAHRRAHQRGFSVVLGHIRPARTLADMPLFERFHARQLDRQVRAYRRGARISGMHLCTGNVSLRRSDYFAIGGFDQELVRSEDRELGIRLEQAGARFAFDERAYTVHGSDHTSLEVWRRRAFLYGVSDSKISDKHAALPSVNPWSYWFQVNPLSRPLLLAASAAPALAGGLSAAASSASLWLDRRGLERLALHGTALVYGLEYFRGMRAHAGSFAKSARAFTSFVLRSLIRGG
jgi:glycosyltransferase involved in cell wall biosynthesis